MIVSAQIRAARGLVGMGQKELADIAGISVATLRRMENDTIGPERSASGAVENVRKALEIAGVIFLKESEVANGPGVFLHTIK